MKSTDKYESEILETIKKHPIFTFQDIFVYYKGCSRSSAYAWSLDKSDAIKNAIYENKRRGVVSMLSKWINSQNATLQIAAMRLICEQNERQLLNQQYIDHTTGGKEIKITLPTANE